LLCNAIDGDWCASEKHVSIKGPQIKLPSGEVLQGQYNRHEFIYKTSTGDAVAEQLIYMRVLNDEEMNLYHLKDNQLGEPETWRRCQVTS
jgi:hypothetical protein